MKLVITGASGSIGQQLVPALLAFGVSIVVVGRNVDLLRAEFPECRTIGYDDIANLPRGYEALLHLATVNSDENLPYADFVSVNVTLAVKTCIAARNAGIKRFVYFSSSHALDDQNLSNYARSKRDAGEALAQVSGIEIVTLFLPKVLRPSMFSFIPTALRPFFISTISAIKPTVDISEIVSIVRALEHQPVGIHTSMLVSNDQQKNAVFKFVKRFLDLSFSLLVLLGFWWLMAIIWILVRLDSPGPGVFRQARVGVEERIFTCYKFRTMHIATPNLGSHEVAASSITRVGRFLRKTKLDELPQAVNILLNQMSLVGPRPCLPSQTILIEERRKKRVFRVKPGITGLAQIHNVDMSTPSQLTSWDDRYLRLQSIYLDGTIILRTALGRGRGDAAS